MHGTTVKNNRWEVYIQWSSLGKIIIQVLLKDGIEKQ
jgi:hypothetical protein